MASTLKSCGTNVVGITLAYVGLVWLRALEQHRNNRWQLSRSDAQNDVGPTPFVNTRPTKLPTKCQSWPYIWLLSGTRLGQWCSLCSNSSFSIIFFLDLLRVLFTCLGKTIMSNFCEKSGRWHSVTCILALCSQQGSFDTKETGCSLAMKIFKYLL